MAKRFLFYLLFFPFITPVEAQKKKPDEKKRLEFENAFMNAEKELMTGNEEKAFNLFEKCSHIDSKQATPFYKLAELSFKKRELKDALEYNEQALKLEPENKWIVLQQAQILEAERSYEKSAESYERLTELAPGDILNYEDAANLFSLAGKYDQAIKVYDKLEKRIGVTETVILQKERLYLLQKKQTKAEAEIQKLIDGYPNEMRYRAMMAELYLSNNQKEKAIEVYRQILVMDPSNGPAHFAMSDYWREKGDAQKAFSEMKLAFSDDKVELKSKLNAMRFYTEGAMGNPMAKEESLALAKILCEKHPNEAGGYIIYGNILYNYKEYVGARDQFQRALVVEPNQPATWQQLISCSIELKQFDRAASDCEKAIENYPDIIEFYLYGCLAYMDQKLYDKAIIKAKAGLEAGIASVNVQCQLLANWADAAYYQKNYKQSDSLYEKALELDGENTYVLNNYAYFLSVRKEKLELAAEMSKRTIEKDGDNPTYLDTYGWILYQQGKYTEAFSYLEKAVQAAASSSEVNEHFGDLQYRLGDKEKAVLYWRRALDLDRSRSLQLEKKIREQKISE